MNFPTLWNPATRWWRPLSVFGLIVVTVITYGVFAGHLGFYWDDWPLIWLYHFLGPRGLASYFANDRPIAGLLYSTLFPKIGMSPLGWHIAAMLSRWVSASAIFITLHLLWRHKSGQVWLISLFVLLYPGFSQQAIAATYLLHHVSFAFFCISLLFTVISVKTRGATCALSWAISLLSAAVAYSIIEYFIGLEFLRPVLIFFASRSGTDSDEHLSPRASLMRWSPYAIVVLMYIVWRLYFFHAASELRDGRALVLAITQSPLSQIADRALGGTRNILMSTIVAWSRAIGPDLVNYSAKSTLLSWAVGGIVGCVGILLFKTFPSESETAGSSGGSTSDRSACTFLFLGVSALLLGGIPNFYANNKISFDDPFLDRYALPYILGSSLVLGAIVQLVGRTRAQQAILAGSILFLFSSFQVRSANEYRRDWIAQREMFWQLAWRAPYVQPGTAVFVAGLPRRSLIRNHAAGMLDLLYGSTGSSGAFAYFIFDQDSEDTTGSIARLKPGEPLIGQLRSFQFRGSTSQSLVMWNPEHGSLRVVDKKHIAENYLLPLSSRALQNSADATTLIDVGHGVPQGPLLDILGPEPPHEWSYYYQRAQLERQLGHWETVLRLEEQSMREGYRPQDPMEWLSFIEADAMNRKYDRAIARTKEVLAGDPYALVPLSMLWRGIVCSQLEVTASLPKAWESLRAELIVEPAVSNNGHCVVER